MRAGWGQSLQCLDDAVRGGLDRQIVLTQLFEAPPARVFQMRTDVAHLERWWCTDGTDFAKVNGPDEIIPDERLVFTHSNTTDPRDPPFTSIVTFEEMDGKTALSPAARLRQCCGARPHRSQIPGRRGCTPDPRTAVRPTGARGKLQDL